MTTMQQLEQSRETLDARQTDIALIHLQNNVGHVLAHDVVEEAKASYGFTSLRDGILDQRARYRVTAPEDAKNEFFPLNFKMLGMSDALVARIDAHRAEIAAAKEAAAKALAPANDVVDANIELRQAGHDVDREGHSGLVGGHAPAGSYAALAETTRGTGQIRGH